MSEQFVRTELLIGKGGLERLAKARVAVFGAGGVGGFAIEALARGGVGALDIFDHDTICLSNLNRQIIATHKTIGQYKVDVSKERILEINPDAVVNAYRLFYSEDMAHEVDLSVYDYVIDAIDTVSAKIELVVQAKAAGVPVISSMGAGNKMDPTKFLVDDIYKTSVCPLAKVMRKELRQRGVDSLKVVYSKEPPVKLREDVVMTEKTAKRHVTGSNSFVPPAAGLIIAGEVIRDLIGF
ncbi:MAG: tRNA threonylcarbamoyladenosine dehydratase [Bacillota bacterium]|nr:tRNA threonylcarbamoyladenosine dehydratase [Bacillota bacterium]